jgi:hypothetical protein
MKTRSLVTLLSAVVFVLAVGYLVGCHEEATTAPDTTLTAVCDSNGAPQRPGIGQLDIATPTDGYTSLGMKDVDRIEMDAPDGTGTKEITRPPMIQREGSVITITITDNTGGITTFRVYLQQ